METLKKFKKEIPKLMNLNFNDRNDVCEHLYYNITAIQQNNARVRISKKKLEMKSILDNSIVKISKKVLDTKSILFSLPEKDYNYWVKSDNYYSMQNFNKFINYFFPDNLEINCCLVLIFSTISPLTTNDFGLCLLKVNDIIFDFII